MFAAAATPERKPYLASASAVSVFRLASLGGSFSPASLRSAALLSSLSFRLASLGGFALVTLVAFRPTARAPPGQRLAPLGGRSSPDGEGAAGTAPRSARRSVFARRRGRRRDSASLRSVEFGGSEKTYGHLVSKRELRCKLLAFVDKRILWAPCAEPRGRVLRPSEFEA